MGRWVWDNDDVTALVIALRRLIHKGHSAKECMELYKTVKNDKNYEDYRVL